MPGLSPQGVKCHCLPLPLHSLHPCSVRTGMLITKTVPPLGSAGKQPKTPKSLGHMKYRSMRENCTSKENCVFQKDSSTESCGNFTFPLDTWVCPKWPRIWLSNMCFLVPCPFGITLSTFATGAKYAKHPVPHIGPDRVGRSTSPSQIDSCTRCAWMFSPCLQHNGNDRCLPPSFFVWIGFQDGV